MSGIFFQPLDELRMHACVKGLSQEGMSLLVHCPQGALLGYYAEILMNSLREAMPRGTLESYFPTDADFLITSFNQMLAQMSVEDAMKPGDLGVVKKVWVVKDAHALELHELQLLGQLVEQFPGSHIRVILLIAGAQPDAAVVQAMGRRTMRWNIALPNAAQTKSFWTQAQAQGKIDALRPMLEQLKLMDHVPAAMQASKAAKNAVPNKKSAAKPGAKSAPGAAKTKIMWGLGLLVLLLACTAFVAWVQPAAFGLDALLNEGKTSNSQPPPEPVSAAVDTAPAPAQAPAELEKPDEVAQAKTESAPSPSPAPANTVVAKPTAAEDTVELPEDALAGRRWAEALSIKKVVVLHGSYKTYAMAKQVKAAYPGMKASHIVPIYKPGEPLAYFVVATGPFASIAEADEFVQQSILPSPGTVRSNRNLQSRLTPNPRP